MKMDTTYQPKAATTTIERNLHRSSIAKNQVSMSHFHTLKRHGWKTQMAIMELLIFVPFTSKKPKNVFPPLPK